MKYISTRGQLAGVDFIEACMRGLAPDGGLYVPERYPIIEEAGSDEQFHSIASRIMSAMAGGIISCDVIDTLCRRAYSSFHHLEVTPIRDLEENTKILELFHGPTLAFKDVAMQFIGQLFDYILEQKRQKLTVICATSGDTGGAAAAAFAKSKNISLIILHPHERISTIQRKFMTCWGSDNILNLAVNADFDACQAIVKSLFEDQDFANQVKLSGVNSINWARIAAQMTYYAYVKSRLEDDGQIRYVVPTGNFGDAFAGYVARRCGLVPANTLFLCTVNENRVLAEIFEKGDVRRVSALATNSPAMDIAVPSNFERLLFEASDRDTEFVSDFYNQLSVSGQKKIPESIHSSLKQLGFDCVSVNQEHTLNEISRLYNKTDVIICPHTAVGTCGTIEKRSGVLDVVLATAHPAKFPEITQQAICIEADLPQEQAIEVQSKEVYEIVENSLHLVRARIKDYVNQ